jgi:hypothetical protein
MTNKLIGRDKEVFIQRTRTKKQIFITMIATHGLKENLYADEFISGVVTLDDLFKEK